MVDKASITIDLVDVYGTRKMNTPGLPGCDVF